MYSLWSLSSFENKCNYSDTQPLAYVALCLFACSTRAGKQEQAIKNEQQMIIVQVVFLSLPLWSEFCLIKDCSSTDYINMVLRNNILMGGYKQNV